LRSCSTPTTDRAPGNRHRRPERRRCGAGNASQHGAAAESRPEPSKPAAPAGTLIHDDPNWWYQGNGVTSATRRIRVYEMPDGRLTAVVTESGDGTSITNAAETVIAQIQAEHPGRQIDVIEHYPASQLAPESFDMVRLNQHGQPEWTGVPAEQVREMLGADAFANGTEPAPRVATGDATQWYLESTGRCRRSRNWPTARSSSPICKARRS
jgi:hypothetical protein